MAKVQVVPFMPAHYLEAVRDVPSWIRPEDSAAAFYQGGPAWTGLVDGAVAICAGISIRWEGLGEAWAVWTPLGQRHLRGCHRAVRSGMAQIIADHRLRRVQAVVIEDFWAGRLWASHLGFEEESTLPAYGPNGETMVMYRWLRTKGGP